MKIEEVIRQLEQLAPPSYQESYDNAGLLTGNPGWECTGILCTLDSTEPVILEAIARGCNLVVAHHPIVFSGIKKLTGRTYVEQTVITAIKNEIAIYAIHTNLDNVIKGVNSRIADQLGLIKRRTLVEKSNNLLKLVVFAPVANAETIKSALFNAGGGVISNYSECSFTTIGTGTFKAGDETNPYVGEKGRRHEERESKIEIIFPAYLQHQLVKAMIAVHPYEEVAYDIYPLQNSLIDVGIGLMGELPKPMEETDLLNLLKAKFNLQVIRHTPLTGKMVTKIAVCGGAGSFLTKHAIAARADVYITGDVKYHEFFDAEDKLLLADIGHWESEQFTIDLLIDFLVANFPTFAVQKSKVITNPVNYFM
ncbi:MAG: Nif3-like dinuclear metal center hexameric protein [Chitinophagaceae bacterium]|nr:Nif3-like dinuclear metal center hexameric protein [Chitinophagaceae bacterium]